MAEASRRRLQAEFGAALLLDVVGAGLVLLIAARTWQTIVTPRPRPLTDDVLAVSGRTLDSAPTALALVALAGVVAVLATRGLVRSVVGALVGLAGVGLVWRSLTAGSAVGAARARELVAGKHSSVVVDANVVPQVQVHTSWAALSAVCGVLVIISGALIVVRGRRWAGMSARYEAPAATDEFAGEVDVESARTRASASLWRALDRGDDPTGEDPSAGPPTPT